MKQYFSISLISLLLVLVSQYASAQYTVVEMDAKPSMYAFKGQTRIHFDYNMGSISGDARSFIDEFSFTGWAFEFEYMVEDDVSVSFNLAWHGFKEKNERDTYEFDEGAVTGVRYAEMHVWPITAGGAYHFLSDGRVEPYLGLNLGAYSIQRLLEVGVITDSDTRWNFGLNPELGFHIPVNEGFGFDIYMKYHWVANTNLSLLPDNINYFTFGLGITLAD